MEREILLNENGPPFMSPYISVLIFDSIGKFFSQIDNAGIWRRNVELWQGAARQGKKWKAKSSGKCEEKSAYVSIFKYLAFFFQCSPHRKLKNFSPFRRAMRELELRMALEMYEAGKRRDTPFFSAPRCCQKRRERVRRPWLRRKISRSFFPLQTLLSWMNGSRSCYHTKSKKIF